MGVDIGQRRQILLSRGLGLFCCVRWARQFILTETGVKCCLLFIPELYFNSITSDSPSLNILLPQRSSEIQIELIKHNCFSSSKT